MFIERLFNNIDNSECLYIGEEDLSDSTPIENYEQFEEVKNALKRFYSPLKQTLIENLAVHLAHIDTTEAGGLSLGTSIASDYKLENELENQPVEYLVELLNKNKIVGDDYRLIISKTDCKLIYAEKEMNFSEIIKEAGYLVEDFYNAELKRAKQFVKLTERD